MDRIGAIVGWLNANSGAMTVLATVVFGAVTSVATVVLVKITSRYVNLTSGMLEVMRGQSTDASEQRDRERARQVDRLREAVLTIKSALMRLPIDLPQYGQTIDDASIWTERELSEMLEAARDVSARAHWIADKAAMNLRGVAGACAMLHQGAPRNPRLLLTDAEYKLTFRLSEHHLQEIVDTELEGRLTLDGGRAALPADRRSLDAVESTVPIALASDGKRTTNASTVAPIADDR